MTDAFMLAEMRIRRTVGVPEEETEGGALRAAAARAGRRVMEVHGPAGERELTLAWVQENPLTPNDPGGPPGGAERDIITFAACLSHCWPDSDEPLFPGVVTTLDDVRDTLKLLGVQQVVHAVNRLRAWGYLAPDLGDGTIRLGPAVATWPDTDVARLRREHAALPRSGGASRE